MLPLVLAFAIVAQPLPVVEVTKDNTSITESCRISIAPGVVIPDLDGNGVIQVEAGGIVVEFAPGSTLRGAEPGAPPDGFAGAGIRIEGRREVTIRGARIEGYKVGVWASGADGLKIETCTFEDLWRMRLKSTAAAEHGDDWLWPHENDKEEWRTRYGAAVSVARSRDVVVRACTARGGQNGLLLDRVTGAKVVDNDFSFLSGWGVALWRSSKNTVERNALDFCVRGYSHGVYNRGQDSAGILMFEQCSENTIAENSATHGGDGFFGFGGKEALGESAPSTAGFTYERKGCNDNLLLRNDFSYAAAHGIEMTFSFGNRFEENRLIENGICGIWGGYGQETLILGNTIKRNGARNGDGKGEGGGINIEHGYGNIMADNTFEENGVGVSLWDDDDVGLLKTPWAKANHKGSDNNRVERSRFRGEGTAVRVRRTRLTGITGNTFENTGKEIDADGESLTQPFHLLANEFKASEVALTGERRPLGARGSLAGREKIIMTEWGPWDHASPMMREVGRVEAVHTFGLYKLPDGELDVGLSEDDHGSVVAHLSAPDRAAPASDGRMLEVRVLSDVPGIHPYALTTRAGTFAQTIRGTLVNCIWDVKFFAWTVDPREAIEEWRKQGEEKGTECSLSSLRLRFGNGGPGEMKLAANVTDAKIPGDRFGTIARTVLPLRAGTYRIKTLSDDGVRVTARTGGLGEEGTTTTIVEDWTWHAPRSVSGVLTVGKPGQEGLIPVELTVEHFELDGFAVLEVEIE